MTSKKPDSSASPSLDTGLLSVASDSLRIGSKDRRGTGFLFFSRILRRLIIEFHRNSSHSVEWSITGFNHAINYTLGDSGKQSAPTQRPNRQPCSKSSARGKKRQERDTDSSGDDEDAADHTGRKRIKKGPADSETRPKFLACPFWKQDPDRHWQCFLKRLNTISYVKQHLARRHTPEFYCQRCFAILSDEPRFNTHVLHAQCVRGPTARLDGILPQQSRQLSRKCKGSIEQQWFSIWDILFPGEQRPSSVYIDSDQSEDFCLFREFSQRDGLDVLLDELRANGLAIQPGITEEDLRDTLRRGLDSMFEHFRIGRASSSASRGDPATDIQSIAATARDTTGDSNTDSGVAVASQLPSISSAYSHHPQTVTAPPPLSAHGQESRPSGLELPGSGQASPGQIMESVRAEAVPVANIAYGAAFPAHFQSSSSQDGQHECDSNAIPDDESVAGAMGLDLDSLFHGMIDTSTEGYSNFQGFFLD